MLADTCSICMRRRAWAGQFACALLVNTGEVGCLIYTIPLCTCPFPHCLQGYAAASNLQNCPLLRMAGKRPGDWQQAPAARKAGGSGCQRAAGSQRRNMHVVFLPVLLRIYLAVPACCPAGHWGVLQARALPVCPRSSGTAASPDHQRDLLPGFQGKCRIPPHLKACGLCARGLLALCYGKPA